MGLKVGGYLLSYEQARNWLKLRKYEGADELENTSLHYALQDMFKERGIKNLKAIITDYPMNSQKPVVLLMVKYNRNIQTTFRSYTELVENDKDRERKQAILDDSGLRDEDVQWVTVSDPYFEDPRRV